MATKFYLYVPPKDGEGDPLKIEPGTHIDISRFIDGVTVTSRGPVEYPAIEAPDVALPDAVLDAYNVERGGIVA